MLRNYYITVLPILPVSQIVKPLSYIIVNINVIFRFALTFINWYSPCIPLLVQAQGQFLLWLLSQIGLNLQEPHKIAQVHCLLSKSRSLPFLYKNINDNSSQLFLRY